MNNSKSKQNDPMQANFRLGDTDMWVTPMMMGTDVMGRYGAKDRNSRAALAAALDEGCNFFDSALSYGKGHAERLLGRVLQGCRQHVHLATKILPTGHRYQQVIDSCHASLKNLGTDYIDLYQIHWPSGVLTSNEIPIEETMEALCQLQRQGKIRAIGVSNFSLPQLQEACRLTKISSIQLCYSLFWRHPECDLLPFCWQQGISVLAYSPLAQGLLTGKFSCHHDVNVQRNRNNTNYENNENNENYVNHESDENNKNHKRKDHNGNKNDRSNKHHTDNRLRNKLFSPPHYERALQALVHLKPLAERYHCSLAQCALAWLLQHKGVVPIVGARLVRQVRENMAAINLQIAKEDLLLLEQASMIVAQDLLHDPYMWDLSVHPVSASAK